MCMSAGGPQSSEVCLCVNSMQVHHRGEPHQLQREHVPARGRRAPGGGGARPPAPDPRPARRLHGRPHAGGHHPHGGLQEGTFVVISHPAVRSGVIPAISWRQCQYTSGLTHGSRRGTQDALVLSCGQVCQAVSACGAAGLPRGLPSAAR